MMKSILKKLTFILSICLLLNSCNNGSNVVNYDEPVVSDSIDVIVHLKEYNNSISPKSRGLNWVGWISVVIADGSGAYTGAKYGGRIGSLFGPHGTTVGAIAGGVIVGAASSIQQYNRANTILRFSPYAISNNNNVSKGIIEKGYVLSKTMISDESYDTGISLGLDSISTKVAIQHNIILENYKMFERDNAITRMDNIESAILNDESFISCYNSVVSDPLNSEFEKDVISDQIMQLYLTAINDSGSNSASINLITSYYINTVKQSSEVPEEQKQWLYKGFAVMTYSYKYWQEKEPFIKE